MSPSSSLLALWVRFVEWLLPTPPTFFSNPMMWAARKMQEKEDLFIVLFIILLSYFLLSIIFFVFFKLSTSLALSTLQAAAAATTTSPTGEADVQAETTGPKGNEPSLTERLQDKFEEFTKTAEQKHIDLLRDTVAEFQGILIGELRSFKQELVDDIRNDLQEKMRKTQALLEEKIDKKHVEYVQAQEQQMKQGYAEKLETAVAAELKKQTESNQAELCQRLDKLEREVEEINNKPSGQQQEEKQQEGAKTTSTASTTGQEKANGTGGSDSK